MKKIKFLSVWNVSFLAIALAAVGSSVSQAGYLTNPWENHFQPWHRLELGVKTSSLTTIANTSKTGTAFSPPGFDKLSRLGVDVHLSYGLGNRFTPYARLSWAYIKTEATTRAGTSFGFADQALGGTFRVAESEKVSFDLQVEGEFPGYSNSEADTNLHPYLGDGSVDFTLGGFIGLALLKHETESLLLEGGGGYQLRGSGFSAAIPWSAKLRYDRSNAGIIGETGLLGYQSLNSDEKKDLVVGDQDTTYNIGSSRSYYANAVNPSLMNVAGKIGYQSASAWQLYVGINAPLASKSAAKATQFFVGVTLRDNRGDAPTENRAADPSISGLAESESETGEEPTEDPQGIAPKKENLSQANKGFLTYSMDAKVVRVNDKLHLVKIDKGHDSQVQVGQRFDIFSVDAEGAPAKAVARARVTSVRATEAALEVTEYFQESLIDEGYIAKRIGPN